MVVSCQYIAKTNKNQSYPPLISGVDCLEILGERILPLHEGHDSYNTRAFLCSHINALRIYILASSEGTGDIHSLIVSRQVLASTNHVKVCIYQVSKGHIASAHRPCVLSLVRHSLRTENRSYVLFEDGIWVGKGGRYRAVFGLLSDLTQ